jgi:hypothetical protein
MNQDEAVLRSKIGKPLVGRFAKQNRQATKLFFSFIRTIPSAQESHLIC